MFWLRCALSSFELIEASPWTTVKTAIWLLSCVVPHFPPCDCSLCQAGVVPKWLLIVMAVITFKYKMHVIFRPWQLEFVPYFRAPQIGTETLSVPDERASHLSHICCRFSRQQDPPCPLNFSQTASHWLKARRRATIWWLLKVNPSRKGLGECWSDLEVYQLIQALFSKGVPQGNIDGKAGLLILEKLLICSLLLLRTLITPHCCACPIEAGVKEPAA